MFTHEIFTLEFSSSSILLVPIFPVWKNHLKINSILSRHSPPRFHTHPTEPWSYQRSRSGPWVNGIVGMNLGYNLTPVQASGLHRQSNPAHFWILATKKPRHFKWHQYTSSYYSWYYLWGHRFFTLEKSSVSKNDDTANNDNNNRLETFLWLVFN